MALLLTLIMSSTAFGASATLNPGDDIQQFIRGLGPGDTITLTAGTYSLGPEEDNEYRSLDLDGIGTADQPITLQGEGEVIIELARGGHILRIEDNSEHIIIKNLTLRGTDDFYAAENSYEAIRVQGSTMVRNVTIDNVTIDKIYGQGITLAGNTEFITIQNCEIKNLRRDAISAGCSDAGCWTQDAIIDHNLIHDVTDGDGIELHNGSQRNTITNNVVYQVVGDGIQTHSAEFGDPNVIEGNVVWNAARGVVVTGSSTVRNNILHSMVENGIFSENERDSLQDVVISYNTIYNTGEWGIDIREWTEAEASSTMVLANNAVANVTGLGLRSNEQGLDPAVHDITNNYISGWVDADFLDTLESHYVPGNGPSDYVDPEAWNFYPCFEGSLVNSADPDGKYYTPERDFSGFQRNGGSPDVGALEHVHATNPGWSLREGFKELTENPPIDTSISDGCCKAESDDTIETTATCLLPLLFLGWRRRRKRTV